MAVITDIRRCGRKIAAKERTVAEVNMDGRYFSMWVYEAGAERGMRLSPLNIQLDRKNAVILKELLEEYLSNQTSNP